MELSIYSGRVHSATHALLRSTPHPAQLHTSLKGITAMDSRITSNASRSCTPVSPSQFGIWQESALEGAATFWRQCRPLLGNLRARYRLHKEARRKKLEFESLTDRQLIDIGFGEPEIRDIRGGSPSSRSIPPG